jgi:hypothetical protein
VTQTRLEPPAYPEIVHTDEDRDRFARLYDDLVRVTGLTPPEALLNAASQFTLGFDVRGPFEKRKRRKKVAMNTVAELPDLEPPG